MKLCSPLIIQRSKCMKVDNLSIDNWISYLLGKFIQYYAYRPLLPNYMWIRGFIC